MASLACWHMTAMPPEIVHLIERDVVDHGWDQNLQRSEVGSGNVDQVIRNSKNGWIPTDHWSAGWIWYYVNKINRNNFLYDITDIDGSNMQFTNYGPGEYYNWHQDQDVDSFYTPRFVEGSTQNRHEDQAIVSGEYVRKLSFVLQLSDPRDYTGGELQFMNHRSKPFCAPKNLGTLIVFDSRVRHRVRKVKSGLRKSLVGWVVGPRWK